MCWELWPGWSIFLIHTHHIESIHLHNISVGQVMSLTITGHQIRITSIGQTVSVTLCRNISDQLTNCEDGVCVHALSDLYGCVVGNSTLAGSSGSADLSHLSVARLILKLYTWPGATEALDSQISFSNFILNLGPRQTALKLIISPPFCSEFP